MKERGEPGDQTHEAKTGRDGDRRRFYGLGLCRYLLPSNSLMPAHAEPLVLPLKVACAGSLAKRPLLRGRYCGANGM